MPTMDTPPSRPDADASLGEAQSANPPDEPDMIEPDAVPLDTDVEDADLFVGDTPHDDDDPRAA